MFSSFLKDTILGFVILFTLITLWHFVPEVIVVSLLVAAVLWVSFLTGFIISLILEGFDYD